MCSEEDRGKVLCEVLKIDVLQRVQKDGQRVSFPHMQLL